MKVITGKVVAGKIVVEGESLEEGSTVTVLAPERDEAFLLDAEAEAALLGAMAEANRNEVITGEALLSQLRDGG
jgi:glutamine synthetase type III